MFCVCDASNTKYAFLEKTVKFKKQKKYGVNKVREMIEIKFHETLNFEAATQSKKKKINPL